MEDTITKTFHFIKDILVAEVVLLEVLVIRSLGAIYIQTKKQKEVNYAILGSANIISPAVFFDDNENMRMSAFIDAGNIYSESFKYQSWMI